MPRADTKPRIKPLCITLGDPAGIGPEITQKAWLSLRRDQDLSFVVVAPADIYTKVPTHIVTDMRDVADMFKTALPVIPIKGLAIHTDEIKPGAPSVHHTALITQSIETSVKLALNGEVDAVITNPIAKNILYQSGFPYPGHTEYLGALTQNHLSPYNSSPYDSSPDESSPDNRGPIMMLSGGGLRVALATIHLPLKDVSQQLTTDKLIKIATIMHGALQTDFAIENPRIAMAGLNPHAGEAGLIGQEDISIINPAAKILRSRGINITDAQPADTLFHHEARAHYDAVLAMYHDQGLIPIKTLDFHGGVNITLGLPIIRTSPDHGTAFAIAGQNTARAESLIAAITTARAIKTARARAHAHRR